MGRLFVYRNFSIQAFPANYNKKIWATKTILLGLCMVLSLKRPAITQYQGEIRRETMFSFMFLDIYFFPVL